jgi:hypothetical protein
MRMRRRARPSFAGGAGGGAVTVFFLAALSMPGAARAWDPLKSAGHSLGEGAIEAIKPGLASTIDDTFAAGHKLVADVDQRLGARVADIDQRLGKQVDHAGGVATQVIARADEGLAQRISQVDGVLDKRITQVADAGHGLVGDIDKSLKQDLDKADGILRDRTHDVGETLRGALSQADEILAQRIEQIDETLGRRLGNVDVIATKQRLAIEQTLLRVAVLVGLLVFLVFVLMRLWKSWGDLAEQAETETVGQYRRRVARALGGGVALQVGGALVAAGVLFVLYQRLPMGAANQALALSDRHKKELDESLALFEFSRVKFHASQLELLLPDDGRHFRAEAAKSELIRDVLSRPALLASPSALASIVARVQAVERLYGDEPDADLLVVKAFVLWQVGRLRQDEHEAASLCARAFRVRPDGFALAPLGRSMIQDFLAAPYVPAQTPLGRDSETLSLLRGVLTRAAPDRPGFPLSDAVALAGAIRRVQAASAGSYVRMVEAHVEVVRLRRAAAGDRTALAAARGARALAAAAVVAAWDAFDREIQEIPGLAGTSAALAVFQLDDATYSRAKWFAVDADSDELPPALAAIDKAARRAQLRPPRVEWSARYGGALGGTRDVLDFQEAERWKAFEGELIVFERDVVAASTGAGAAAAAARRGAALRAAHLALFVSQPRTGAPVAYAEVLLGGDLAAAQAAAKTEDVRRELAGVRAALEERAGFFFHPRERAPATGGGGGSEKKGAARTPARGA